jgi:hypothetical protein
MLNTPISVGGKILNLYYVVYYTISSISDESAWFFNEQYMIYSPAPASEDSIASWKIDELWILFFPTSLMKMSLNFKFFYNYFTPLFFESSGSGVSINANNSV